MASSEGNYHRRGPYFDGTNFASWKHKMKMHILGHNPAIWAIVLIGLQGEYFEDGREPDREASAEESKMLQYNAQACDILFNRLCPEEFNKSSRLENAKESRILCLICTKVLSPSRNPNWMCFKVNLTGSK